MLIYVITNRINRKVYIGQTKHYALYKRWPRRLCASKVNPHLAAAIRKYGADSFTQRIICHATCKEELDLLERFFIAVFQSTNHKFGYNKTTGGTGNPQYTPEIRKIISDSNRKAWRRGIHRKHAEKVKQWWRALPEGEKRLHRLRQSLGRSGQSIRGHPPWNKGLRGLPSARKGKKYGRQKNPCRNFPSFTEEHKQRISQALRRFHRQRRKAQKNSGSEKAAKRRTTRTRSNRT